jgi:predicted NACHT family NTPase
MDPIALIVSTAVSKFYDVMKDEFKQAKKAASLRKMFLDSLQETIDAAIQRKNIPPPDRPEVERMLNKVLTEEELYQYCAQYSEDIGFRFNQLLTELDLKRHFIDRADIEFFKQALLDKLREKLPEKYQNFLVEEIHRLLNDLLGKLSQPNHQVDPGPLREAYLNWLFEETSQVYLTGIDPQAKGKAGSALKLSAVYTALLIQTPEKEARWPSADFSGKTKHSSVLEQLDRHPRLVLMGDPGSGKSTFVNFVAMCLAGESMEEKKPEATLDILTAPLPDNQGNPGEEHQPWNQGILLPLRIILRDFAANGRLGPTAEHLWLFIQKELQTHGHEAFFEVLRQELVNRGGLILLDGLDEVPEIESRPQIKRAIEDFAKANPRCRILVTSRTYAYQKQDWKLNGFAEAILIPFSDGQIRRFVDCWYTHTAALIQKSEPWAKAGAEALKQAIFKSDRLHPLAQRPLLLTLMASLHAWGSGQLPEKREQLYEETMNLLFKVWEAA